MTTLPQAQGGPARAARAAPDAPVASSFGTWLARNCMGPPSLRRRFLRHARRAWLRLRPSPWQANYFGQPLLFPSQHDLIELTNDLPLFNTPLRRLAQSIRGADRSLRLLDIGANIGEGLPLVDPQPGDQYWLVEGSQLFLPFLRANVAGYRDVTVFSTYLADAPSHTRGAEVIVAGNAHLDAKAEGSLAFETLDRLLPTSGDAAPNLLKIDVEGYEPKVLAGGRQLLANAQPVVFIEWHPKLLRQEGFDVFASLDLLLAAGYDVALVYDNHGMLLGEFRLEDRNHLGHLARYAQLRDLFYYDLSVFAPAHHQLFQKFSREEAALYAQLASPSPSSVR